MPTYTREDNIILAISKPYIYHEKLSLRAAAKMYNVPHQTLSDRMKGVPQREKTRVKQRKLDPLENQMLVQYAFDQDERGFPLRLAGLKDMANYLLKSKNEAPVGKY